MYHYKAKYNGISCILAALSNRTRKLADADNVKPLALLWRSFRDTSVNNSASSDRGWDLLFSVDGAIWLHKCSLGPPSSFCTF